MSKYIDLRATMSEWRDRGVVSDRDERKQEEMATAIGMKRGWWSREKDLLPCDAVLVDQLYDVGPDSTARTKDLVNHRTRRAAGYNYLYTHRTVSVRNQGQCGSDMFNGHRTTCKLVDLMDASGANPKAQYHWRRANYSAQQVETDKLGSVRHIKNDKDSVIKATKKFYREQMKFLQEKYGEEELHEDYQKATTATQQIRWMLENYTEEQWHDLLGYHGRETLEYKGECAWSKEAAPCLHHDGAIQETVPVYWVDSETEKPLYITTRWQQWYASWSISYPEQGELRHLYDLDDPDAFLAEHIDDKHVVRELGKSAQRCRTESRNWLRSTWTEDKQVLSVDDEGNPIMVQEYVKDENNNWKEDDDGNYIKQDTDEQATRTVLYYHGVRGHYCLRWWDRITQKRENDALIAEMARKDGEQENGWVFEHDGSTGGEWRPMPEHIPMIYRVAYTTQDRWGNTSSKILPFIFDTPEAGLDFVIAASPHLSTSYRMADGIATQRLFVEHKTETYRLPLEGDPNRFTPQEVAEMCRGNTVPEDYLIINQPYNHTYDIEPIMDIMEYVGAGNIGLPPEKKEVEA
jgi:hypothetical protein